MAAASSSSSADLDIEKLLAKEATAFQRDLEVDRILKAFKLNPYDILDIDEKATAEEIKRKYRQVSLLIHPDKTAHERAPEAFDILKKAESELSDTKKREDLDAVIKESRSLVLKELSLPTSTSDDDPKLKDALKAHPVVGPAGPVALTFKARLRLKCKELLIDEEVRRRKAIKMNLANEGLEARMKEHEVATKKRKIEEEKTWEDNRDSRVDNWRDFSKSGKKKKKQKVAILG